MIIGEIFQVKGVKVTARLYNSFPPYISHSGNVIQGPRIYSFVKTNVGLDKVVCKVIGEYQDINKNGERVLELIVVGSFVDGKFSSGVKVLPLVSANVELITAIEYEQLYVNPKYSFEIGEDLFNSSFKVRLDMNKILPSHIGIFGNTGSGKSNTLTKITKNFLESVFINNVESNKVKIILFDINNEYGNDSIVNKENKNIYRLSTRTSGSKYPILYESLTEDQIGVLLSATQKTQMPVVKVAYASLKNDFNHSKKLDSIKWALVNGQRQLINSIKQELSDFVEGLSDFHYHSKLNSYIDSPKTIFNSIGTPLHHIINDIKDDSLEKILVKKPSNFLDRLRFEIVYAIIDYLKTGNNFEYVRPLIGRLKARITDFEKVFTSDLKYIDNRIIDVIQLAEVNNDMREIIPSIISSLIFDEKRVTERNNGIKQLTIIIIDEAHNILYQPKESDNVASNNIETFESIIKEGRKFGLFLWLSSQRPSDISPTITSQIHHYFIHKLVNNSDIVSIRKTIPFVDEEIISMISAFGVGECVISGQALSNPTFVKISQVEKLSEPLSSNVVLFGDGGILNSNSN